MSTDAAFWDNIAESYAAKPVDDPSAFERKIEITKALTRPDDTLLTVGCGTGSLELILSSGVKHIHGLDISSEMLRIAREKAEAQGAENLTFHETPFDDSFTALGPESVEGLLTFSILHLLPDRQAALRRMFSMVKPGGYFVTSTVVLGESWVPYRALLWAMRLVGKAPFVSIVDKATLTRELEEAGFVDVRQPDVGAEAIVAFMTARKPE